MPTGPSERATSYDRYDYPDAPAMTDSTRKFEGLKKAPGKTVPGAQGSYSGRLVESFVL
ncbi:MAG: hypothetical protein QOH39_1106 [Verrucomicrobiota bacterium]